MLNHIGYKEYFLWTWQVKESPPTPPTAAAGIDTASAADTGVEFVSTAAAGSDTLSPAVGGFGSTDTDPDCPWIAVGGSISMLEPAVGRCKHTLLRSTKAFSTQRKKKNSGGCLQKSLCQQRPSSIPTDPASATPTEDPAIGRHSIHTDPAGATPTDPAVGGHSIPTDPAATDATGRCTWR